MKQSLNILILSGTNQEKLIETCRKRGHNPILKNPTDFNLYISDSVNGFDAIYDDVEGNRVKIKDIDACITRIGSNREYATNIIEHLQMNLGIFCVQSGTAINNCADKFKAAQKFSQNGIKVPKQWYAFSPGNIKFMIEKLGKLPVILKEITGSKGAGIIILESPLQTNMTLESYYRKGVKIILQEFISNGGKDERHIVVGDKVVCSMERQAPKSDIRANVSLSGIGKKIDADNETKDICVKMAQSIPGLNFAGCDVMKILDSEGKAKIYAIEINSNPGEKIIDVTGHNYFDDLVEFVEANYNKRTNQLNSSIIDSIYNSDVLNKPVNNYSDLESANAFCRANPENINECIKALTSVKF
ncbi:MAG: ATP-grasp domain-containing protein [Bacteroidota bacterium]|nr:MAG: ATP-grasp domain-containing protein [Bacteroidota bacterium]